jgi:hypothetical protein
MRISKEWHTAHIGEQRLAPAHTLIIVACARLYSTALMEDTSMMVTAPRELSGQ